MVVTAGGGAEGGGDTGALARLRNGRALAYEGLYAWPLALADYNEAMRLAADGKGAYTTLHFLSSNSAAVVELCTLQLLKLSYPLRCSR